MPRKLERHGKAIADYPTSELMTYAQSQSAGKKRMKSRKELVRRGVDMDTLFMVADDDGY